MLCLENLSVCYGPITALQGISLTVPAGEVVGLIGANGVGKTTTLNAISGLLSPSEGRILFEDKKICGLSPEAIVRLGIVHVPEGRKIFQRMTVEENLDLGAFTRSSQQAIAQDRERIYEMFPILRERRGQVAGTLSGGQQQMLAIGRGLMARPRVLMLDEPSMGLAPIIQDQIFDIIRDINASGTTILLVEQNARAALELSARAYVMDSGRIALSGSGAELIADDRVRKTYLGEA